MYQIQFQFVLWFENFVCGGGGGVGGYGRGLMGWLGFFDVFDIGNVTATPTMVFYASCAKKKYV